MAEIEKPDGYNPVGDPRTGRPPLPGEKERERRFAQEDAGEATHSDDEIEVVEIGDGELAEVEDFQPGQLVSLKSGGPVMTVSGIENGMVACQWFGEGDEIQTGSFGLEMLEPVEGDELQNG